MQRKKAEGKLQEVYVELEDAHKHAMYMFAIVSEYRDPEMSGHIKCIGLMVTDLALEMGIEPETAERMGIDSLLHDLDKLGISDSILLKREKLTFDEFVIVKQHPLIGAQIIGDNEWFAQTRQISLYHHEKWDGSGYPKGLKGDDIPLTARIVAVADVFDALVTKRAYKKIWTIEEAVLEIKRESGMHFEPKVVNAFLSLHKQGSFLKLNFD